jgi:hypothetical protein
MKYLLLIAATFSFATASQKQSPIMNNLDPSLPPTQQLNNDTVILTDVLGRDRSINIFAGFTRMINSVDERLGDANTNTTILAPLNSAITSLPRKPWEDPKDYMMLGADAYEGEDGEDRAHANLKRFVEAHIVTESPWVERVVAETLNGERVWWETKNGMRVVSQRRSKFPTVSHHGSRFSQEISRYLG